MACSPKGRTEVPSRREILTRMLAAMVGMAGQNVDFSSLPRGNGLDELGVSPDNALQMTNELTNLFELVGNYGSFNGPTPGPDNFNPAFGDSSGGLDMTAPFQNEPEFSRIMNELF